MYAKVNGQQLVQYPYNLNLLKAEYPDTSFPASMTDDQLTEFDIVRVVVTSQPSHDPLTQSVDQAQPAFVAERDRWEQQWTVRAATAEEIASRKQALQNDVVRQTQQRLDDFARTRNYDGILSACTYATSTVPKFQAEGQYCVEARDDTWATLYTLLAEVEAGTRPIPSGFSDIEPELPVLAWPV
jgi:hypothetical protein